MEEFPIIPEKTAMLFFDTLNIYFKPENAPSEAAAEIASQVEALTKMYKACGENGIAVFYGQADHRPDGKDFAPHIVSRGYAGTPNEGPRKTTPPGAMSGTWGAQIIDELASQPHDYTIKKHRWSAFFETHLELSLRTAGIDTIIIGGTTTEIGIASTAYSARDLDYNLIILRDACRGGRPGMDKFWMETIFPGFARVMSVDQAISKIARPV